MKRPVYCEGNGLCDRLVTRSEEPYRTRARVCVCVSNCVSRSNLSNN